MNAAALLAEVHRLGIILEPRGDRLHVEAPRGVLTGEIIEQLRRSKEGVLTLLEGWPSECLDAEQRFGQRSARLFPLLGRAVSTPQGRGRLLQVLGSTAAIILDADPEGAVFLRVVEVSPVG